MAGFADIIKDAQPYIYGGPGPQGPPGPGTGAGAWAPSTAYTAGQVIQAPDGSMVRRNTSGTSRAAFDATERATWTAVAGVPGTMENESLSIHVATPDPPPGLERRPQLPTQRPSAWSPAPHPARRALAYPDQGGRMKVDRYALRQAARKERMVAEIQRVGLHRARGVMIVPTSLGGPVMHYAPRGGA